MNSNSLNVNFYCSNIRDEKRDEEQCWSRFLHFGSSFVDVESSAGAALMPPILSGSISWLAFTLQSLCFFTGLSNATIP